LADEHKLARVSINIGIEFSIGQVQIWRLKFAIIHPFTETF